MKNITKSGLLLVTLSLAFGSGFLASKKQYQSAEATIEYPNNPTFINDYSTISGQSWQSNNDPTDGQSSDAATYRNALKSTTSGYKHDGVFTLTTHVSSDVTDPSYIQAKSSSTDDFLAQYIPAHMEFQVGAYSKVVYNLTFNLSAKRSLTGNNQDTRADFSTEFFYYGETVQNPTTWFYHQNDFTSSTTRGYSEYRVADEVPGNTVDHDVTKTITFENNTGNIVTKTIYLGMFCYMESSGKTGEFTGKLSVRSTTKEVTNAVARVNGTNYYTAASAISAYNAAEGATLTILTDLDLSANNYSLSSAGGTIDLLYHSIDLGSTYLSINANTTITASNGSITSSNYYATVAINTEATLTLNEYAAIENTSTTSTARAVLLGHSKAKIYVGENARVTSNYYGVQIDNGHLYCSGRIISNNSSYAIYIGSSNESYKYIFLYGSNVQAQKVRINNLTKTRFYATSTTSSTGTSYSSSNSVSIELNSVSAGDTIVKNVNDSNYNKFSLSSAPGYVLSRSSSVMYVAYRQYTVTYTLTNLSSDGAATCTIANDLSFTLTPDVGNYYLPSAITVRVGSTTLTVDTHYTYNSSTGAVTILKENINGDIAVTASAISKYTIIFIGPDGNEVIDSMLVNYNYKYIFVAPDSLPAYHHVEWYENEARTGTVHYANGTSYKYITDDITFYAVYAQWATEKYQEFVYGYMHMDDYNSELGYCKDSEHHYYASAKDFFENSFNTSERNYVKEHYADAFNRFCAWARANGEEVVKQSGDYIVREAYMTSQEIGSEDNSAATIALIASFVTLSFATLILIKKKRSVK